MRAWKGLGAPFPWTRVSIRSALLGGLIRHARISFILLLLLLLHVI